MAVEPLGGGGEKEKNKILDEWIVFVIRLSPKSGDNVDAQYAGVPGGFLKFFYTC
jgi:hypothetical protein